jgi:hypothetical protein
VWQKFEAKLQNRAELFEEDGISVVRMTGPAGGDRHFPRRETRGALQRFLGLADGTPTDVLGFIRHFGFLDLCQHGGANSLGAFSPYTHWRDRRSGEGGLCPISLNHPIPVYREYAKRLRAAIALAEAVKKWKSLKDDRRPTWSSIASHDGLKAHYQLLANHHYGPLVGMPQSEGIARDLVCLETSYWMSSAKLHPTLVWPGGAQWPTSLWEPVRLIHAWRVWAAGAPPDLWAVIAYGFLAEVQGVSLDETRPVVCRMPGCGSQFNPRRREGARGPLPQYCEAHRNSPERWALAMRQSRQRRKEIANAKPNRSTPTAKAPARKPQNRPR